MLGLCFGAYELLGVFQGCFSYDHPLPYHSHQSLEEPIAEEPEPEEEQEVCFLASGIIDVFD